MRLTYNQGLISFSNCANFLDWLQMCSKAALDLVESVLPKADSTLEKLDLPETEQTSPINKETGTKIWILLDIMT